MPDKDDATPAIVAATKAFAKDMQDRASKILEEDGPDTKSSAKSGNKAPAPKIEIEFDTNPVNATRSPEEQARMVFKAGGKGKGGSQVCWSAHMLDKARHVTVKIDGKTVTGEPALKKAFGKKYKELQSVWGLCLKDNGLVNAKGTAKWYDGSLGDFFHVELPASKLRNFEDPGVQACLEEYVLLSRKANIKNEAFEDKYKDLLAPIIKKYETKNKP